MLNRQISPPFTDIRCHGNHCLLDNPSANGHSAGTMSSTIITINYLFRNPSGTLVSCPPVQAKGTKCLLSLFILMVPYKFLLNFTRSHHQMPIQLIDTALQFCLPSSWISGASPSACKFCLFRYLWSTLPASACKFSMDLATDVYIPEDYVKSRPRPNRSVQKRDGRVSFNDIETANQKKFQLPADKNMMISTSTSHSVSSSFKEDILFSYFNP